jgi:hypothetical protein
MNRLDVRLKFVGTSSIVYKSMYLKIPVAWDIIRTIGMVDCYVFILNSCTV